MDNYKKLEYLEPQNDGTFKHIESGCPTNGNPLVEIPEGAEIAFYFGAEYNHIVFYKKVGKTVFVMSPNYLDWNETTYKEIDEVPYTYADGFMVWERNKQVEKDPALISGADAHQALLAGENVQYSGDGGEEHWDTALNCNIGVFLNHEKFPDFKFRIVPRTIKLELELPKPFEPKEGDEYFYISTLQNCLYSHDVWSDEPADITQAAFGAYKTEDDVKKAVEQLRKIRGTNS